MMVVIARESGSGKAISLGSIAKTTMISRRYLEQLAIGLRSASLLRGVSGRGGGYLLTQPASDITIRQIVESAIGPINIVHCVLHPDECLRADVCECRDIYCRINRGIVDVLEDVSLAALAGHGAIDASCKPLEGIPHECHQQPT